MLPGEEEVEEEEEKVENERGGGIEAGENKDSGPLC